jgi:hypothetical protein
VDDCPREFFSALMDRLSAYSDMAVEDFREQNSRDRRHVIDFEQTTEKSGFLGAPGVDGNNDLAYSEAWQFGLSRDERWRVHGFIIDDTFYIVWFDPNHSLYLD